MDEHTPQDILGTEEIEEKIAVLFFKQRKLAKDAKQELLGKKFKIQRFQQILHWEKQLLRCVIFMHQTYESSSVAKKFLSTQLHLQEFNNGLYAALTAITDQIGKNKGHLTSAIDMPPIHHVKNIGKMALEKLNTEDYLYVSNFLFCAETLVKAVHELILLKTPKVI